MTQRRSRFNRLVTGVFAGGLIAAGLLAGPAAQAADPDPLTGKEAQALAKQLGGKRTAGVYLDAQGRSVVTVTDSAAAQTVRAAGGTARIVEHSAAELGAATASLDAAVTTPGTAWGTDVRSNTVVVEADRTVSAAEYASLKQAAAKLGTAAEVHRTGGEIRKEIAGGNYIRSDDGLQCSVGFNVRKKADNASLYMITAGHCTVGATGVSDWYDGNDTYVGYDAGGRFPDGGNDYGLIRHYNANISKPGNVYLHNGSYQDITHSRDPYDGESVCRSGYRTGYNCGTVQSTNVTVNYPEGTLTGLFSTNICSSGGDSGGPVFHGDAGLGIHSGSNGACTGYHQKLNEALAWYEVEVY